MKRRSFLRGVGGAVVATPLLTSLLPAAPASAAGGARIKRLFTTSSSHGGRNSYMFPAADGASFRTIADNAKALDLAALPASFSPAYSEGWNRHRDKMLFLKHLDPLCVHGHNSSIALGAWSDAEGWEHNRVRQPHATIDRIIADHIYESEPSGPRVLNLGFGPVENAIGMPSFSQIRTSSGDVVRAPAEEDARAVFDSLFRNFEAPSDDREQHRARSLLAVDAVLEEYRAQRHGRRISSLDADRLDAHMEHLFDLERRISTRVAPAVCDVPSAPDGGNAGNLNRFDDLSTDMLDISVAAMRCDLTRVVNFLSRHEYAQSYIDISTNTHEAHHGAPVGGHSDDMLAHTKYVNDAVLHLVDQMDQTVDADGSPFLDSTVIFSTRELSNQGQEHQNRNQPVLLVGGGDCLNTGQLISYATEHRRSDYSEFVGRSYDGLLVTLMLAMGLTPEQWQAETGDRVGDLTDKTLDSDLSDGFIVVGAGDEPLPGVLQA